MALTQTDAKAAEYDPDGPSFQVVYDTDGSGTGTEAVPNFGLRLYPSGSKSWVIRYRNEAGRTRLATIGRWPTMPVAKARDRAKKELVKVSDGRDPLQERREKRTAATTVKDVWEEYLAHHAKPNRKSWPEDERRYKKHVGPAIGSKRVTDVTRGDLRALHRGIAKSAPVEANRVLELVRVVFNFGMGHGDLVPDDFQNPAELTRRTNALGGRKIRLKKERSRTRWLRKTEAKNLMEATEQEDHPYVEAVVKLLLYTGLRKSELLSARWDQVDEERRELTIPERKSGEPLTVPLSGPAWEIISSLPRQMGSPWIFPSPVNRDDHLKDIKRYWNRIRENAGLEDLTVHDLRRTAGSWMAQAGVPLAHIQQVLGQQSEEVVKVYARLAEDTARDAVDAVAAQMDAVVNGEDE